jgi:uncharacterized iron-regulated membrane protein
MTIRPFIFWPHLIAGTVAGIVILLMSVTGVLLTYERQMIAWADSGYRSEVPDSGAPRLPVETLLARVAESRPDVRPTAVTVAAERDAPIVLTVTPQALYVDAYTGRVLGEGSQAIRTLMSRLRAWHRWIAVDGARRPIARAITGWSNVIFLFIVVSGFYLWWPRKWTWQRVKPVVLFRRGVQGKARDFNWHNVIGMWSAVPLFIIVLTALPISFPWANAAVYRVVGEAPPAPPAGRGDRAEPAVVRRVDGAQADVRRQPLAVSGLDALMARAERHVPGWRTISLRLPASPRGPVTFAIDQGDGGQPQLRSTLTLDRETGSVVTYESFADQSLGRRLRSISRFAHTGEVLGIPGQTIAGVATGGAVVLVWTGIALALRRFGAWLKRRDNTAAPAARQSTAA